MSDSDFGLIIGIAASVLNLALALYGYYKATVIRKTLTELGHDPSSSQDTLHDIPPYSKDCGLSKESYDIISKPEFYPSISKMIWYGMSLAKLGVANTLLSWGGLIPDAGIAFSIISLISTLVGLYFWIMMLIAPKDQKIVMKDIRKAVNGGRKLKFFKLIADSVEMVVDANDHHDSSSGSGAYNQQGMHRYVHKAAIAKDAVVVAKPRSSSSPKKARHAQYYSSSDSDSQTEADAQADRYHHHGSNLSNSQSSSRYNDSRTGTTSTFNDAESHSQEHMIQVGDRHGGARSDNSDLNSFHGPGADTGANARRSRRSANSHGRASTASSDSGNLKPVDCSSCGYTMRSMFCAECGARRPKPVRSTCAGCAVRIVSKVCSKCGTNNTRSFHALQRRKHADTAAG
jgi:hypothetical protein